MRATATRVILTLTLLAGVSIGLYLTAHHDSQLYGDKAFKLENCPQTETVDCEAVNTSDWSELAGTPIAAFAVPFYLLVIVLLWSGVRNERAISYAFALGLAATAVSATLFYVSKVKIGFLCLWCMRLYGINVAIPVLAVVIAWRSPLALLAETFADLTRWPKALQLTAAGFAALVATTVAGERLYRSHVHEAARQRAATQTSTASLGGGNQGNPPVRPAPAGASTAGASSTAPAEPDPSTIVPYRLAGPLRRVIPGKDHFRAEDLDVQSRLGSGTPVALVYWAPGFDWSERALVELTTELKQRWPAIEVYPVAGLRPDERAEEPYEVFGQLPLDRSLPLLIDDGFIVAHPLKAEEVPSVVLFDGKGKLIASGIKTLSQRVVTPEGPVTASDLITRVVSGVETSTVRAAYPYFPGMDFDRHCAPGFTLKKFGTDEDFPFTPRSESGRPRMLVFWSATCKHCQLEMPQLVSWLAAHPDTVDVVSVTRVPADRPGQPSHRAITTEYVKKTGITWPVLDDAGGTVNALYDVVSTPTSFFVSPDGTVLDEWFYAHPDGFDAAMEKALAKARAPSATACSVVAPHPLPSVAFDVRDTAGGTHPITALAGKPAVVHFWATWCQPCLQELPQLMMFKQRLEASGEGKVILVSVEGASAGPTIAAFTQRVGLGFQSYFAPSGGIADQIDLSYHVPRTYLVSAGGQLIEILHGKQEWDDPSFASGVLARLRSSART